MTLTLAEAKHLKRGATRNHDAPEPPADGSPYCSHCGNTGTDQDPEAGLGLDPDEVAELIPLIHKHYPTSKQPEAELSVQLWLSMMPSDEVNAGGALAYNDWAASYNVNRPLSETALDREFPSAMVEWRERNTARNATRMCLDEGACAKRRADRFPDKQVHPAVRPLVEEAEREAEVHAAAVAIAEGFVREMAAMVSAGAEGTGLDELALTVAGPPPPTAYPAVMDPEFPHAFPPSMHNLHQLPVFHGLPKPASKPGKPDSKPRRRKVSRPYTQTQVARGQRARRQRKGRSG